MFLQFELGMLIKTAAEQFKELGGVPYVSYCSDPCDGRSQGTSGMMDSLPYRNDAAIVMRRLSRSIPTTKGVLGIATCDKGLPAMMMALAGTPNKPTIIIVIKRGSMKCIRIIISKTTYILTKREIF